MLDLHLVVSETGWSVPKDVVLLGDAVDDDRKHTMLDRTELNLMLVGRFFLFFKYKSSTRTLLMMLIRYARLLV